MMSRLCCHLLTLTLGFVCLMEACACVRRRQLSQALFPSPERQTLHSEGTPTAPAAASCSHSLLSSPRLLSVQRALAFIKMFQVGVESNWRVWWRAEAGGVREPARVEMSRQE